MYVLVMEGNAKGRIDPKSGQFESSSAGTGQLESLSAGMGLKRPDSSVSRTGRCNEPALSASEFVFEEKYIFNRRT